MFVLLCKVGLVACYGGDGLDAYGRGVEGYGAYDGPGIAVVLASGHYSANGAVAQGSQPKGDSNNTTIFVVGLDSDISDEDLRQHYCESDSDNTTIFVVGLDSDISDEDIRQHYCESGSNNTTIFVVGLDSDISDEDLRQPILQFCEVVSENSSGKRVWICSIC
uniref:Uncharacterized protein n=1 Tax=Phaseolus vulgaris TaxID=3885 RepID=V7CEG2_PHAVU|nr:hypothetical protein PHAVU_003G294700g [Phaseolus vulgaris]ESW28534.1 hypothetical protein PHAVU_003G294700g [Phaseolus vulgaris]